MAMTQRNGPRGLVADINVTPLVDVMLVLLIIFMVTAPMMTQGLDVDLPETTAKSLRQEEKAPLIITVDKEGTIQLRDKPLNQAFLKDQLLANVKDPKSQPIFLRADKQVPYGLVVSIMADVKSAGFDKLGMITQPLEPKSR
ncbi:MAG: protein TolR [Thermodesulfobacteriota bacterium]